MLAIDHIVIVANNPEKAAHNFGKEHNVTVVEGGKHDNWGTYNYLAYFSNDCYIEWIGIFNKKAAEQSENPLIKQIVDALKNNVEGVIQYALRTDQMDQYIKYFQRANISFTGPIPGTRKRPDSSMLEWRMLFPASRHDSLPFLIEWGGIRNLDKTDIINKKQIKTVSENITNLKGFENVFQINFQNGRTQLANTLLTSSDKLTFSIK